MGEFFAHINDLFDELLRSSVAVTKGEEVEADREQSVAAKGDEQIQRKL